MNVDLFHAFLALLAILLPLFLAWGLLAWGERKPSRERSQKPLRKPPQL
jgi:hypothetical protein